MPCWPGPATGPTWGTSAGAAAGEVDLAGLAEQVTEQGREISALARTIARMRRRLEDEGISVAETPEEGAGRRADAMYGMAWGR